MQKSVRFLKLFFKQISPTLLLLIAVAIIYAYLMSFIDHSYSWIPYLVVLLALFKAIYFTFYTFKKVNKSIRFCHSFWQLLLVFGVIIVLMIFSFTADYTCLYEVNNASFRGLEVSTDLNYFNNLFKMFYFSVVTFASVGYGDITPQTISAQFITIIIEISQSFVLVIFGLSNINNININNKNRRI